MRSIPSETGPGEKPTDTRSVYRVYVDNTTLIYIDYQQLGENGVVKALENKYGNRVTKVRLLRTMVLGTAKKKEIVADGP